ncbi:MAG: SulP family inorganic anion transporter [Pseudomonadota bacterium]|nr:SulP family inorganic anion transporter [Pseudomonadota bacterium]
MPAFLRRALPFLNWPRPSLALLRTEALAGLTVGLMMVPQAVAYAQLAGMPPVTGIYAALLPALVAVLFASAKRLSVGPTALTALLVSAALTGLAEPGSAQWVTLAVWLALMSGALQVLLGLARFGWLLNLVSAPVLMAFTQGAAVLIIASQLPALLGLPSLGLHTLAGGPWPAWDWRAALYGGVALALLVLLKHWRPAFPSVLLVVLATAALAWATGFEAAGGAVVGALPHGLPTLALPGWPGWATLSQLILPALVITLVSFLETASSARVDSERLGQHWNQDQDLLSQGLAKLAAGLSGTWATSASFSRSALNLYAGAQTGWATVCMVAVVLAVLLLLTPVLQHVPRAVLAAIVVAAVLGLIKPREFVRLWRVSRPEAVMAAITLALTLAAAPALYWGVLAGVLMTLGHFVYQRLHPRIIEVGLHTDGSLRDRQLWQLPPLAPHTLALRLDAALDFATASALESRVAGELAAQAGVRHLVLFAQPINRIDATGCETLLKLMLRTQGQGITWHLAGLKLPVENRLRAAGALHPGPQLRLYRTDTQALAALRRMAEEEGHTPADLPAAAI